MSAEPTDADRAKAAALVNGLSPEQAYVDEFIYDGGVQPLIDAIAQALADEREQALPPGHGDPGTDTKGPRG